jgi:hypothetical protein
LLRNRASRFRSATVSIIWPQAKFLAVQEPVLHLRSNATLHTSGFRRFH